VATDCSQQDYNALMGTVAVAKKKCAFNPGTFLATIGEGRKSLTISKKQGIFTQGDVSDAVFYIRRGKVRLTVVSQASSRSFETADTPA
jgi:CRP/FNR family transcriptional regulator, cyclic AMP receptor protein